MKRPAPSLYGLVFIFKITVKYLFRALHCSGRLISIYNTDRHSDLRLLCRGISDKQTVIRPCSHLLGRTGLSGRADRNTIQ